MKKLILSLFALAALNSAHADEGMWLPYLIGKNYKEMSEMGLKLSADDLYSANHSSLKDAIVQFNGGCTGEIISSTGLLLTNHHCGYDPIAALSTVEKNYLQNGFWAYGNKEELPAKGVHVLFLQNMSDVTAEIAKAVGKSTGEKYDKKFAAVKKEIEDRESKGGQYTTAVVKEYFNGNQYIVLTYKKYTDIRLVGTPPRSLGKYGGDIDNWMWPRHTADFSLFRVYAGKDNEPAEYAPGNVPYKPKHYLPISISGQQDNDYAMVMGYPGRTNRYEVSYGIDLAINEQNPSIVKIRDARLAIMRKHMQADPALYLKQTSSYSRIANYWKYFIGQTEQLKRLNVVEKKRTEEENFTSWARQNDEENSTLINRFGSIYKQYQPYAKHAVYYNECFRAPALTRLATALEPLDKTLSSTTLNQDTITKYVNRLKDARKAVMKEFSYAMDKELFAEMAKLYYQDVSRSQLPDVYQKVIFTKYGNTDINKTFSDYANYVYGNTWLLNDAKFEAFCNNPTEELIKSDPAAEYAISTIRNFSKYYQPRIENFNTQKKELSKRYVKSLMQMKKGELMYPDANSTMRITYGQVKSYSPQDAVYYNYFTTLDGFMEKYKPGSEDFDAPKELVALYKKKDYGRYADADGTLHTCFISNNDITGGNSGSPVINGNGELIGCAFDGNWEAMSGDIAFDKTYKRTISVDVRFILFIIEKLGKANNLIEEMDIR